MGPAFIKKEPEIAPDIPDNTNFWRTLSVRYLGCVQCRMPLVERPRVAGGKARMVRRHLWRGGHDPAMIASALSAKVSEVPSGSGRDRTFTLTLTNIGTPHYLPTGTPNRHLIVEWGLLDRAGNIINRRRDTLERLVLWRPFVVDLRDTRLAYRQPRVYRFVFSLNQRPRPGQLEVLVRCHLPHESRRERIGYSNTTPIPYPVFEQTIALGMNSTGVER